MPRTVHDLTVPEVQYTLTCASCGTQSSFDLKQQIIHETDASGDTVGLTYSLSDKPQDYNFSEMALGVSQPPPTPLVDETYIICPLCRAGDLRADVEALLVNRRP